MGATSIINMFTLKVRGSTLVVRTVVYRRQILSNKVDPRSVKVKRQNLTTKVYPRTERVNYL